MLLLFFSNFQLNPPILRPCSSGVGPVDGLILTKPGQGLSTQFHNEN
jgi:hypothetical protein